VTSEEEGNNGERANAPSTAEAQDSSLPTDKAQASDPAADGAATSITLGFEAVKQLTTLAAGSTVLIATFLKDIFPKLAEQGNMLKWTVSGAFLFFGASLVAATYSLGGLAVMSRSWKQIRTPRTRWRYRRFLALPPFFFVTGLLLFSLAVLIHILGFEGQRRSLLVGAFAVVFLFLLLFMGHYLWWAPRSFTTLTTIFRSPSPKRPIHKHTPTIKASICHQKTGMVPKEIRLFVDRQEVPTTKFKYDSRKGILVYKDAALPPGERHKVEVWATDPYGKQASAKWKFHVKKLDRVGVGSKAPDFVLPSQTEDMVSLGDFLQTKPVVLFFYPKNDTPGCTKQVCAFKDAHEEIVKLDAEVIGISSDSVDSHRAFASKHDLPYTLLSDEVGQVRKRYGVRKSFGFFPNRVTYVIDEQGVVRHAFSSQLGVERHVEEAIKTLRGYDRVPKRP
jgi:thioredoxin-dependent peroxiredoxin